MDEPIDFIYDDTDIFQNEISEIYSYCEESEFYANRNAFEESMEDCGLPLTWKHMVREQKFRALNHLMSTVEVSCWQTRMKTCRALTYLVQGNFGECSSLEEQIENTKENVYTLYEHGLFSIFVQQLLVEADLSNLDQQILQQHQQRSDSITSIRTCENHPQLRFILSALCTILETMYHAKDSKDEFVLALRDQFIAELQQPFGDELLPVILFQMLNDFGNGLAPHYPVRKITLLLWKVILITLGGSDTLKNLKDESRKVAGLDPLTEDPIEVTKNMRPCSPNNERGGHLAQSRVRATLQDFANKRKVYKQTAFDDAAFAYAKDCLSSLLTESNQTDPEDNHEEKDCRKMKFDSQIDQILENYLENPSTDNTDGSMISDGGEIYEYECREEYRKKKSRSDSKEESDEIITGVDNESFPTPKDIDLSDDPEKDELTIPTIGDEIDLSSDSNLLDQDQQCNQTSTSPQSDSKDGQLRVLSPNINQGHSPRGLPWSPKIRRTDLDSHMCNIRQKFLGYILSNDLETTFGLPNPIIEGILVLKKYMYVSLSEVQIQKEELMEKYPFTQKEINPNYRDTPAEKLYLSLLPKLPQYMIALLKILLDASAKNKSERPESINVMNEISSYYSSQTGSESSKLLHMKSVINASRHKEIIIKAGSAILLLLLKHFKVNHVYQFEYVSQQLMFANCIPLILKFLSQIMYTTIPQSNIASLDFPACVIGEQSELTSEDIFEYCCSSPCWRNMFSCINMVRILNKVTKWKHSRMMMLVVFKSAPTLTKALKVRHSMFQLYILKLLKIQLKFLGRQWKKNNMEIISAIYQKVRHRLTDDWAYSNDTEARPWDYQAEEFTLQANINKFHQRRYQNLLNPSKANNSTRNSWMNQSNKVNGLEDYVDCYNDLGYDDAITIPPHFEGFYERWLESEVYQREIDWNKLLAN